MSPQTALSDKTNNSFSPSPSPLKASAKAARSPKPETDIVAAKSPRAFDPSDDFVGSPPPPPPPPPAEEVDVATSKPQTVLDAALEHIPLVSDTTLKAAAAASPVLSLFYLTSASPVGLVSWVVMVALIANGVYTFFRTPEPATPAQLSSAAVLPAIEAALDATLVLGERFRRGEPLLTFGAAVGAWALSHATNLLSVSSLFCFGYSAVTFALSAKWAHARGLDASLARQPATRTAAAPLAAEPSCCCC